MRREKGGKKNEPSQTKEKLKAGGVASVQKEIMLFKKKKILYNFYYKAI